MRTHCREVDSLLRTHIAEAHVAPGATACVAHRSDAGWSFALGAAGVRSQLRPDRVTVDAFFDLASLTKPLFAVTLARLHDAGTLSLDDPLSAHLPWLADTFAGSATLEMLIAHRAGLDAHVELFAPLLDGVPVDVHQALCRAADAVRPEVRDAGSGAFAPCYSDLGYLLAGMAVQEVTGRALDEVFDEQLGALGLFELGSARRLAARFPEFPRRVVPTEVVAYRGGEVVGVVHDDNAWALGGPGSCGHAGLFGTAHDIARFGALMLDQLSARRSVLSTDVATRLLRERTDGTLRAGFDGKSAGESSVGARLGAKTFGHLGFTGTSVWCDPESGVVVTLLSNRVSPTRDNPSIARARPLVHDALVATLHVGAGGPR